MNKELDEKKTKYFVIAIVLLILLSVILIIHFNNKSLVSGEEEVTTTTTTTVVTTTTKKVKKNKNKVKKEEVQEQPVISDSVVYKSTIDEENKLIYNYKLSDEISDTDVIKSVILSIDEVLKEKSIIGLYDISLYDANMVKKSVKNTLIDISIPLNGDLIGYDEYKIVYIDDEGNISDEEFKSVIEDGYIKFSTTHLSKFGIIGIKKEVIEEEKEPVKEEVDLSNVTIDVLVNDVVVEELNNIYVETKDVIDIKVNDLDKDYKLYYLLKDENNSNTYQEFNKNMFESITTPSKYELVIKLVVLETEKIFEVGTVNIYDIVFAYDETKELEESEEYGTIIDENGEESDYVDMETNKNIVVDNITKEEVEDEEKPTTDVEGEQVVPSDDVEKEDEITGESESEKTEETLSNISSEEKTDNTLVEPDETLTEGTEEDTTEQNGSKTDGEMDESVVEGEDESQEEVLDVATIKLKGNIYLVEETDITKLEITGHLIIDTNEDITYDNSKLNNVYTITIKSKEFSLNGQKYTYEYVEDSIVIKRVEEKEEEDNTIVSKEEFENLFDGYHYDDTKEEIVLETKEK